MFEHYIAMLSVVFFVASALIARFAIRIAYDEGALRAGVPGFAWASMTVALVLALCAGALMS